MSEAKIFPETESYCAEPPSEEGGPNYVPSSESVGAGHEQSMNRMPDPNVEWATSSATPENVVANPNTPTSN